MPKLIYRPKNSPYYVYDFKVPGVRFCRSTKCKNRAEARKIAEGVRAHAVADGHGVRKHMTLREATGRYWEEHGRHQKSAEDFIWPKLCALIDGLGADTRLDAISNDRIARYISDRRRQPGRNGGIKTATVNGDMNILRAVLRMARDGWDVDIGREPNWKIHKRKPDAERRRYLSYDEQDRLLGQLSPDLATMVVFSLISGVRLASATGLRWADVHRDHIVLRNVKSTRENEQHSIPVTPELRVLLQTLRGQYPDFVFTYVCARGRRSAGRPERVRGRRYPFTETNWRKAWRVVLGTAGITDLRWHDLRHTSATRLLKATGNLVLVQRLLGHASIVTTQRYAHVEIEDVEAGMRQVSRIFPESETARGGSLAVSVAYTRTYQDAEHADHEAPEACALSN
jgi:integrase